MAVCVYVAVFQFSYTAVFGAYTAFIFLRTGGSRLDNFIFAYWASVLLTTSFTTISVSKTPNRTVVQENIYCILFVRADNLFWKLFFLTRNNYIHNSLMCH